MRKTKTKPRKKKKNRHTILCINPLPFYLLGMSADKKNRPPGAAPLQF
jgi:hypothetical protein